MAEKIISKGFYTHPEIPNFVSVKQYVVIKKGKENQLFLRFENPKNETLTAISFTLECYDTDGKVIKTSKIEQHNLKAKGHSCFVVNRPAVLEAGYVDFKVTINSARYGDYCYVTHGDDIEIIYEKADNTHEIDRVPFLHKLGGHTHKAIFKTVNMPRFFAALVSLVVISLFLVLGIKIHNFTRTEKLFTLDMVEYTFATNDRENGPIIIVGCKSKAANIIVPDKIEGHDVVAVESGSFAQSNVRTINFEGSIEIKDQAFAGALNLRSIHIDSTNALGAHAFYNCRNLTSVAIDEGLTVIGQEAFANCNSLTDVSLPDSIRSINDNAFHNCYNLKALVIPDSTTHIGSGIIANCVSLEFLQTPFIGSDSYDETTLEYFYDSVTPSSLKNLVVTKMDKIHSRMFDAEGSLESIIFTTPVTKIDDFAFSDCSNLRTFDIHNTVNHIGAGAFQNCYSLETVTIPESVTSINYYTFKGCSSLKSLTLPSTLTSIGESAFFDCNRLDALIIPSSVTYIGDNALRGCTGLKSLVLPFLGNSVSTQSQTLTNIIGNSTDCALEDFTLLSGITLPDYAFAGFEKLTCVTLPDELLSISSNCFDNCKSLSEIEISNTITSIGQFAFRGCASLESVNIPESVSSVESYSFAECSALETVVFDGAATQIGESAFSNCTSLTHVKLPNDLTSVSDHMFNGCSSLEAVIIPTGVTEINEYAFANCKLLKNVVLPLNLVTIGSYAFSNCSSLPSFEFATTVETIGGEAFSGCTSLKSIIIPETVLNVGAYAFSNCDSIESMTAPFPTDYSYGSTFNYYFSGSSHPESLKRVIISRIKDQCLPSDAFEDFSGIEELTLPEDILSIGADAFKNCSSLTTLTIPDSVTSMGYGMLIGTNSLESITLPYAGISESSYSDGFSYFYYDSYYGYHQYTSNLKTVTVTKATAIPDSAFSNMTSISQVNLPETITHIGESAFYGCYSLTDILLPASLTSISGYAFSECVRLYEVTNLSALNVNDYFPYALRVFSSEEEKALNKIESGDFALLRAADSTWYLVNYERGVDSLQLPSNLFNDASIVKYQLPSRLFYNDSALKEINISQDVTKINPYTFAGCYNLTTVSSEHTTSFEEICDNAFSDSGIQSVEIPSSTRTIGRYAFSYTGIVSVACPASLTTISPYAFYSCWSLNSVTFDSASQLNTIGENAFANTSITQITLPYSLTDIAPYAFYSCSSLSSVNINANGRLNAIGEYAFANTGVTSILIPSALKTIGANAFNSCTALKSVTFEEGSQINSIGDYAFAYSGVESITFPATVSNLGYYAFYCCSSLKNVTFTKGSLLETISDYTFYNCTKLSDVAFEDSSRLSTIGQYAFTTSAIKAINLPASLTTVNYSAFSDCLYLESVTFESGSKLSTIENYAFSRSGVKNISFPSALTSIGEYAFDGCTSLESVTFEPESQLNSIGRYAFRDSAIKAVTFPASLTEIGYSAFENCHKLESVVFETGSKISKIKDYAFYRSAITTISLPESLSSLGNNAFGECSNLVSVKIRSDFGIYSNAFYGCNSIFEVYNLANLPLTIGSDDYSGIAKNAIIIHTDENAEALHDVTVNNLEYKKSGNNWFLMGLCENNNSKNLVLKSFDYNGTRADNIVVYKDAFNNNQQITSVTIGDGIVEIMPRAFAGCINVESLEFEQDCVITKISDNAFENCGKITSLILPDSLTKIGSNAFYACGNLQIVLLPENLDEIGVNAFNSCYRLYDVMNLSDIRITAGDYENGYVGYYALAVRKSASPLSVTTILTDTTSTSFVKHNNAWHLVYLEITSDTGVLEIPELVVDGTSYKFQIFEYALMPLQSCNRAVLIHNNITKITDIAFYSLQNHQLYFEGDQKAWNNLNKANLDLSVYFHSDCVHEYGYWIYDENGKIIDTPFEMDIIVTVEPTCKTPGLQKIVCPVCKEEKVEAIPETNEHSFVDDECTVCGNKQKTIKVNAENFDTLDFMQNDTVYPFYIDDSGVIRSQNHLDSSSSSLTITASQTMTISFDYKVESEGNCDWFKIYLNDNETKISGHRNYQTYSVTLNAGDTLVFTYTKDGSVSYESDCAFIKDLTITIIETAEA